MAAFYFSMKYIITIQKIDGKKIIILDLKSLDYGIKYKHIIMCIRNTTITLYYTI